MKTSYHWLQTFFAQSLPTPTELESLLTFHSCEIEEITAVGSDSLIDVKVLPDKSAWLMSHLGIAREISVITGIPLKSDPFKNTSKLVPQLSNLTVSINTPDCNYYGAALMSDVKVGPSPVWLSEKLATIGQRSINNVVDATNYVMNELGQPLHAFDAGKLKMIDGNYHLSVRGARDTEGITTLTSEDFLLSAGQMLIVDANCDEAIAIAGIKGGKKAAVDNNTTSIIIESAHFDRVSVRNTSKVIKLRTDASARYENGISKAVAPIALEVVVKLITEIASGKLTGYCESGDSTVVRQKVSATLGRINSILGLSIKMSDVEEIIKKFGYNYEISGEEILVTPPFERDDLVIADDLIEEIGRIYGLDKIISIPPKIETTIDFNTRHFYAEKIRHELFKLGFSEIFTSSFRALDTVKIKNALASDKSFLRSSLGENVREAVLKNIPNRDLLGLPEIAVFEIGTVFAESSESFNVALGVQTGTSYKAKVDNVLLTKAREAIELVLSVKINWENNIEGVTEFSLDTILESLPKVAAYDHIEKTPEIIYEPFSVYPSVTRDIALWVDKGVTAEEVEKIINACAGYLRVRTTLFDIFSKDNRTSLGFRLVFQSKEKTLDSSEVDSLMKVVYDAAVGAGFEVR